MNIFESYLDKIKLILINLSKQGELLIPETFNGINAEIPPAQFDCDISTNVAMVLSKLKVSPIQTSSGTITTKVFLLSKAVMRKLLETKLMPTLRPTLRLGEKTQAKQRSSTI